MFGPNRMAIPAATEFLFCRFRRYREIRSFLRLGSECLLQALALDTDVWRQVAENVRERHGHELMCSQLAQAGQTWFEVTVEGLIAEGVPR